MTVPVMKLQQTLACTCAGGGGTASDAAIDWQSVQHCTDPGSAVFEKLHGSLLNLI